MMPEEIYIIGTIVSFLSPIVALACQSYFRWGDRKRDALMETWQRICVYSALYVDKEVEELNVSQELLYEYFRRNKPFYSANLFSKLTRLIHEYRWLQKFKIPSGYYDNVNGNWVKKSHSEAAELTQEQKVRKLMDEIETLIVKESKWSFLI